MVTRKRKHCAWLLLRSKTSCAQAIASYRESGILAEDWGDEIKEDFLRRGGKGKDKSKK